MGASATDLMGVGVPGEQAKRVGDIIGGPVAGIGTAQAGAAPLVGTVTSVTTTGGATAFILPAHNAGRTAEVYNTSSTAALVYPPVGATLNGSLNGSLSIAQNKGAFFRFLTTTQVVANLSA